MRVILSALLKLSQESKELAAPVIHGGRKQGELLESSLCEDSYMHTLIRPGSCPGWTGPEIETDAVWTLVIQNSWLIKGLFNFEIVVAFQVRCKEGGPVGAARFPSPDRCEARELGAGINFPSLPRMAYCLSLLAFRDGLSGLILLAYLSVHRLLLSRTQCLIHSRCSTDAGWTKEKNEKEKRVCFLWAGKGQWKGVQVLSGLGPREEN